MPWANRPRFVPVRGGRRAGRRRGAGGRAGQSLIESCIVVAVFCLIFFGLFQLSQLFAAKEFLDYSAARGARARTVGFNQFMVWKTARVGAIPNAGKMVSPAFVKTPPTWSVGTPSAMWAAWHGALTTTPSSEQFAIESSRVPLYLGAEWPGALPPILDYDEWDTVEIGDPVEDAFTGMLKMKVSQDYPLRLPLHRAFYADDSVELAGEARIENHYPLYIVPTEY